MTRVACRENQFTAQVLFPGIDFVQLKAQVLFQFDSVQRLKQLLKILILNSSCLKREAVRFEPTLESYPNPFGPICCPLMLSCALYHLGRHTVCCSLILALAGAAQCCLVALVRYSNSA